MARDIASYGGVVIMLGMLREHAREEETVAATVHILYLITHADVMRGEVEVEVQRSHGYRCGDWCGQGDRGGVVGERDVDAGERAPFSFYRGALIVNKCGSRRSIVECLAISERACRGEDYRCRRGFN